MAKLWHLSLLSLLTAPGALGQNGNNNKIDSIKAIGSFVDVAFTSPDEFPVRDALIQVHFGDQIFTLSRVPANGDLHTIVFSIPANDFANKIKDGDRVWIDFRGDGERGQRWEFGSLNKDLLNEK